MAKKLADIVKDIEDRTNSFDCFLKNLLIGDVWNFIEQLKGYGRVYVFSGVIRDYFLNAIDNRGVRDIDIMIDNDDVSMENIYGIVSKYEYKQNSFKGFKIKIDNITIDLWHLKGTWAWKSQPPIDIFPKYQLVPYTSFFNFSSIIYSLDDKKFLYSKYFVKFLKDKSIDLVLSDNPNHPLCIVNAFYYSEQLDLKMGEDLKKYIKRYALNNNYLSKIENVQKKHFGKILYSEKELIKKVEELNKSEDKKAKTKFSSLLF